MSPVPEPPDWLLPSWDAVPDDPDDVPVRRPAAPGGTFGLRVKTVSEVSKAIKDRVRSDDGLRDLWVEGEVGRVTVSSAGHAYFSLKDAEGNPGVLRCAMFRRAVTLLDFTPADGQVRVVLASPVDERPQRLGIPRAVFPTGKESAAIGERQRNAEVEADERIGWQRVDQPFEHVGARPAMSRAD